MSGLVAAGAALGALVGVGLCLVLGGIPRLAPPRLVDRVAPFLQDVSEHAYELSARRSSPRRPGSWPVVRRLDPVLGLRGTAAADPVDARLRLAGVRIGADALRLAVVAAGIGTALLVAVAGGIAVGASRPLAAVALAVVAAAAPVLAAELWLRSARSGRVRRIERELPTVLEFLALSLSAGESAGDALARVARVGRGDLSGRIAAAVDRIGTGTPLAEALAGLASELRVPGVTRLVDQLVGAIDRGAPLAEVLRAQASDTRQVGRRQLLEEAGRREIGMMVPLVFLILPLSVLFAIVPGVIVLQGGLL